MEMKMDLLSIFLSPADDGPYSKGGKDAGGADVALVCRRQSIPGDDPHPRAAPPLPLCQPWRHRELWVRFRQHWLCT